MFENWTKWAVGEGLMKTTNRTLSKFFGVTAGTAEATFAATVVIGVVQTIFGFFGALHRKEALVTSSRQILGSVSFGFIATIMTVLGFIVFTFPGADVGIVTFIITLSIVPGIVLDRVFFGEKLLARQYLGIILFLFAGWAMLGFISLQELIMLPAWVLVAFGLMFLYPLNEFITRKLAVRDKADPFVNNFWIGISTVIFSIVGFLFFVRSDWYELFYFGKVFWLVSIAMGFVVTLMVVFKLVAYKSGGTIALKKLVMQGTHLLTAVLAGAFIFGEAITIGKIIGILIFFVAFSLVDKNTWGAFVNFSKHFLRPKT